jgi:hypothetical protein
MEANLVVADATVCFGLRPPSGRMLLGVPIDQGSESLSWPQVSTRLAFQLMRVRGIL